MADSFDVLEVMDSIKREINDSCISIKDQYLANGYYERRMQEYRRQDELVIFGAGKFGRQLYHILNVENIHTVKCFCDNAADRWARKLDGLDILSLEQAVKQFPDAMYIITPRGYENEILRQLVDAGITAGHISIFITDLTGLEA